MKLINGDCIKELAKFEEGSVDLTVTSPPYDDLRTYNGGVKKWNDQNWKPVIEQLFRVTADGGVVVWVVGDATVNGSETGTSFRQALFAMDCGFNLHDTMIYEKAALAFPGGRDRYYSSFEYMFVWSKGKPKTFNPISDRVNLAAGSVVKGRERKRDGSFNDGMSCTGNRSGYYGLRYNIWRIPNNTGPRSEHPAIFPEALARDHIISWSNPGDVVLDPFTGSGTTGAMAVSLGRKFVGIELDKQYFEGAKKRIEKAANQANSGLFKRHTPPTTKPQQRKGIWS